MLVGILAGAGIMLTYVTIGFLVGQHIRRIARELAKDDADIPTVSFK